VLLIAAAWIASLLADGVRPSSIGWIRALGRHTVDLLAALAGVLARPGRRLAARLIQHWPLLRSFAANAVLLVLSLLLALLSAEAGFRLLEGIPLLTMDNVVARRADLLRVHYMNVYDPILGWRLADNQFTGPETGGRDLFASGEHGVRMNRHEITPVPRRALLATGDSFTAGSEVNDWQTWPAYLEASLERAVVNAAAGGWGADQIVLRAEMLIPELDPSGVIVSFMVEDIVRTSFRTFGGGNKPYYTLEDGELVAHHQPVPRFSGRSGEVGWLRSLLGHSELLGRVVEGVGLAEWWFLSNVSLRSEVDMGGISCRLLERLKVKTDAVGIPLYFVLQYGGSHITIWEDQPSYAKQVLDCTRLAGIPSVNTWEPLREIDRRDPTELKTLYNMFENGTVFGHMSPRGNQLIADLVASLIRASEPRTEER